MKQKISFLILAFVLFAMGSQAKKEEAQLSIKSINLDYPCPAIPFYHFFAELELPEASIIEVEAEVNGKVLRSTDLYREKDVIEKEYPPLSHRPPSGYGLSHDATLYKNPNVVGWVKWEPGKKYNIKLTVRMKEGVENSSDDKFLSQTVTLTSPNDAKIFDTAWKNYKSVVLSETAGIDRKSEAVEAVVAFYPDEAFDLKREVRVVEFDSKTHAVKEVPCQVYDLQKYTEEDDMAPDENGNPTHAVPLWFPTLSARVAFLADVPANTSKVYLIYYNNDKALTKVYNSNLKVQGEMPGISIDNGALTVSLHNNSGHLDQLTLKDRPDFPLFHRMETNGAVHWNPGIYSPPRPWTHTADWNPPKNINLISGPVVTVAELWDNLRDIPEVDASVRYEFHPDVPYIITTTNMRINETINCIALRNGEVVFKRELMTHAAWFDAVRNKVITYDVTDMPDLTDLKMEDDVPWISFYNKDTHIGFAGIQLSYANTGIESRERLLNPYMYITGGPWIYWARALSLPFLSSNMQQMVPAMKGNFFTEKWAYLVFETKDGEEPYQPVLDWKKRLTHPLKIHLVEEVDNRVSKTVQEIYIDEGKSGWEERETGKHHE
ncbi:hypothetical protein GM418_19275 [Maribellus comscasis]|uniref:Uncharacterized protein n=1 Tax=Maribellus comscasis TaxID=2681766 RepID=A0A6I6K6S9_9BACT|nr:hypothetical protein [Maribellus comscasis]QGY45734.1 hypothetical protein GM418_19275 [Maribellus comscasis]